MTETELWMDDEASGPIPRILVRAAGLTDPGRMRSHNEDAILMAPAHQLYAVADGMGGYAAGEIAAQMTVDTLRTTFDSEAFGELPNGVPRRAAELQRAIQRANTRIRNESAQDERKRGMGNTVVCARFSPSKRRVYIAHVGDSRCYRLRGGKLESLTTDHTLASAGIKGPTSSKLSRAVGVFDQVEVDVTIDEPAAGDHYILCSDGLFKMVPESVIEEILGRDWSSVDEATKTLVDEANQRGGRDNISVIVAKVEEPEIHTAESGEHRIDGQ